MRTSRAILAFVAEGTRPLPSLDEPRITRRRPHRGPSPCERLGLDTWLRREDLNLRSSGYEPDVLTELHYRAIGWVRKQN